MMIRMLLILSVCLVIACSRPSEPATPGEDAMAMLKAYHQAMESDGLMAEFDFLDDSEAFFWIPPGYDSPLDYDSVRAVIEMNAEGIDAIQIEWEILEVKALSDDIATFYGTVHSSMTHTAGQVNVSRLIESGTLIRRSDGWKLLSGQSRLLPDER